MAFTGQLAVITGGGSGMGQAWARQLANEGATVAILDVNSEGMADTASGLTVFIGLKSTSRIRSGKRRIPRYRSSLGPVERVSMPRLSCHLGVSLKRIRVSPIR